MADCAGTPTTVGSTLLREGAGGRCRQRRRGPHAPRRPGDRGPQQHQRVWPRTDDGAGLRRRDGQSVARGPVAGRLVRWFSCRRCGARPADGACDRRRRLDPHSGRPVRPVRPEAVARPDQPGADRRDPGRGGRAALRVDLGARQRGAARRAGRRRAGRSLSCARRPRARSSTPRGARRAGCASPSCASPSAATRSIRCWSRPSSARRSFWRCSAITSRRPRPTTMPRRPGMAFGTVMCANTFTNIQVRANGRVPGPDDLEPVTRLYAERGRAGQRARLHPRRPDLPSHGAPARRLLREVRHPAVADDCADLAAARHGADGR